VTEDSVESLTIQRVTDDLAVTGILAVIEDLVESLTFQRVTNDLAVTGILAVIEDLVESLTFQRVTRPPRGRDSPEKRIREAIPLPGVEGRYTPWDRVPVGRRQE
jgi:hypothetical protein